MSDARGEIFTEYRGALRDYLGGAGESALHRSYDLARLAIARGLGVLDMVSIHHEAIEIALELEKSAPECLRLVRAGSMFLMETLAPFEMTHRAFREANAALRHMNDSLEEQTKRIAHTVHDEAGQLLSSVHIALAAIAADLNPPARERLGEVRALLDRIEKQIRRLSHELRPTILDDLGLMPALEFLAEGVGERAGIPISIEGRLDRRLTPAIETALYRVVQEALNNVSRHAHARRASIRVTQENGSVRCFVRDDGKGFVVASALTGGVRGGLGLRGMQERLNGLGGRLLVDSAPGQGTELSITIPTGG